MDDDPAGAVHDADPDPHPPPPASPSESASASASAPSTIGPAAAVALVFGASAAVLVVEIVSLRLLAPYLGLTLETSTLVIGLALAAIATGSWIGGRWADTRNPGPILPILLAVSGVAVTATPFLIQATGLATGDRGLLLLVAAATIMIPGMLLSTITPIVTKLRLRSLTETGTIVGRLSAIGTVGAIVGTVVTGFVLISRVPITRIMVGLGIALTLAAALMARARSRGPATALIVATLVGGIGAVAAPQECDAETSYHCAVVREDRNRPTGRVLVLDGLWHSYVDLADPRHREFTYVRAITAAIDAHVPAPRPLTAHFLGGGGLTLPRYLPVQRPGTSSTVSEIDPGVVEVDRSKLGFRDSEAVRVQVEDARLGLRAVGPGSLDLVVGDAFGGVSVPWHLTTREHTEVVKRSLRGGGLYAVNLIDHGSLAFARAELATLTGSFEHVALAATREATAGRGGGNLVALASDAPLDVAAWRRQLTAESVPWEVIDGERLRGWIGDAPVLTDDYAPVDQLLTAYL